MDAEDGTLTINTANAYTGGTELLKGNIAVNHAQAFGSGSVAMATGTGLTLGNGITPCQQHFHDGDGIFTISGDKTATLNGLLSDTAGKLRRKTCQVRRWNARPWKCFQYLHGGNANHGRHPVI